MMTDLQLRKELAEQNLVTEYPSIDSLCGATRSSILIQLLDRKAQLYDAPSPEIGEIGRIYKDCNASERFLKQCMIYLYVLKENISPNDTIVRIHASNFFIACRHNTVNQLLCFVADYPSMKQFSRGFDYTHFASKFKEYCCDWVDQQNKILERKHKEEERLTNLPQGTTGRDALLLYLEAACSRGVDIRQSPLYGRSKEYKAFIDSIARKYQGFSQEATDAHYRTNEIAASVRWNRRNLPTWLLSMDEIIDFSNDEAF